MRMWFWAVIALPLAAGQIWIRTEPGLEVSLDGEPAGVTTLEARGLFLSGLREGEHSLTIRTAQGETRTLAVQVRDNHTETVHFSTLGLRTKLRKAGETGSVPVIVPEKHRIILDADIPGDWKRALISSMTSGIDVERLTSVDRVTILVAFRCPNPQAAARLGMNLYRRPEIQRVEVEERVILENGMRMSFRIEFVTARPLKIAP